MKELCSVIKKENPRKKTKKTSKIIVVFSERATISVLN